MPYSWFNAFYSRALFSFYWQCMNTYGEWGSCVCKYALIYPYRAGDISNVFWLSGVVYNEDKSPRIIHHDSRESS